MTTVARPTACVLALAAVLAVGIRPLAPAEESSAPLAEVGPKPAAVEPLPAAELETSIDRGVKFLVDVQREDGSWGSADNTNGGVDIYAPPPGGHHAFRAAVTALCVAALIESGHDDGVYVLVGE